MAVFLAANCFAQDITGQISIFPVIADETLSSEAAQQLSNKMKSVIANNGLGVMPYAERIVLCANVDVIENAVTPTNPPMVSKKLQINFIAGDILDNKTFSSCSVVLNGIGATDSKAFIAAFKRFPVSNKEIAEMIGKAKDEMNRYYGSSAQNFISKAKSISTGDNYDEAVAYLMSVPPVNEKCVGTCRDYAVQLYMDKTNKESRACLDAARAEWISDKSSSGAARALPYLRKVLPEAKCYPEAVALWKEISKKLDADEKDAKDFAAKQYEDRQAFKGAIVDACKAVGTAFGEHRPQSVTRIVGGWFL